ncbi:PspC domain-containing protein [Chloroflexus aggregans]|uniref:Phage shock protein C, PspC n=1 Tax=Chloroflexus aggregans (strain MD-66 / DSM 9485) TaxID=326427 RepID=B8G5H8_CHLAD|nr:PspC domain-containing protein [Chloroflexus aggregans]ACL25684.1 phage shock protein C, PspC [Chloroflexus aggregans DSM 9485]
MNTQTQRLLRVRTERMLAGVAGGLARYFGIDPIIVRLIFVGLGLVNGIGVIIYLVLWLLMPNEDAAPTDNNLNVAIGEMQDVIERLFAEIRDVLRRL